MPPAGSCVRRGILPWRPTGAHPQLLLPRRHATTQVRTLNYCELNMLLSKDFSDVISDFPSFAEVCVCAPRGAFRAVTFSAPCLSACALELGVMLA